MCALREPLGDISRIGMYALLFITLFRINLILLLFLLLFTIYYCYLEFYIVPH